MAASRVYMRALKDAVAIPKVIPGGADEVSKSPGNGGPAPDRKRVVALRGLGRDG